MNNLSHSEKYALELASEKKTPNWLNALPLSRYNFNLKNPNSGMEFMLDMDWNHPTFHSQEHVVNFLTLPTPFTVQRLVTPSWGMTKSDIFLPTSWARFALMLKSSRNISRLQGESFVNNSSTTDEDARIDDKINGLWSLRFSRTFFDVKVFNPHAKSSRRLLEKAYNRESDINRYLYRYMFKSILSTKNDFFEKQFSIWIS